MSRIWTAYAVQCVGFPRVSGDEPINETGLKTLDRFSPRERG